MTTPKPWYRDPLIWLTLALLAPAICWVLISLVGLSTLRSVEGAVWAAWVQAIGSIAAIFIAIWVARRQSQQQDSQEKRREISQMTQRFVAFIAIASDLLARVRPHEMPRTREDGMTYFNLFMDPDALDMYLEELEELRVGDLPSRASIEAALELRHRCPELLRHLRAAREILQGVGAQNEPQGSFAMRIARARMSRDEIVEAVDALRAELVRLTNPEVPV